MLGWKKHKLESRLLEEISITKASSNIRNKARYADDTTLKAESEEDLKSLLMKVKVESESWLKAQHSEKRRSWHPVPPLHGK